MSKSALILNTLRMTWTCAALLILLAKRSAAFSHSVLVTLASYSAGCRSATSTCVRVRARERVSVRERATVRL